MTHVTCRLTVKNWDQLWNPALCNQVWATFTFFNSALHVTRLKYKLVINVLVVAMLMLIRLLGYWSMAVMKAI